MSDKTLGQINYDAFRGDDDYPQWSSLPQRSKDMWEAAAQAVVGAHEKAKWTGWAKELPAPTYTKARLERAVIEEAKAVNKYWKSSAPEKLEALFRAVEALEELER
jgi:hypothetical protein